MVSGKKGPPKGVSNNPKGRPKGIKDRRVAYIDALETLKDMGHNPIEALTIIARESSNELNRIKANAILADKSSPSLRSVEHKTDESQHSDLILLKKQMLELENANKKDY